MDSISKKEFLNMLIGVDENGKSKSTAILSIDLIDKNNSKVHRIAKRKSTTTAFIKRITAVPTAVPDDEEICIVMDFSNGGFQDLKQFMELFEETALINSDYSLNEFADLILTLYPTGLGGNFVLNCKLPQHVGSNPTDIGEASTLLYINYDVQTVHFNKSNTPVIKEDELDEIPDEYADYTEDMFDGEYAEEDDSENDYEDPEPEVTEEDDLYD